jgi:TIR domain
MIHVTGAMEVFIVYAANSADEGHRENLEKHLSVLTRQQEIVLRHERLVTADKDTQAELKGMLDGADVIVLLLSPDFIASDFCYNDQMSVAMKRQRDHTARVIPVLVGSCYWEPLPFSELKVLPASRKAITSHPDEASAWTEVAREIHAAIKELRGLPNASLRTRLQQPPRQPAAPPPRGRRLKPPHPLRRHGLPILR